MGNPAYAVETTEICNTADYQEVSEKYGGASAPIDLNYQNLKDYLMNQELYRHESICPRIFLSMKKLTDTPFGFSTYKGNLIVGHSGIVYKGQAKSIARHTSGDTLKDNQFNTWQGDWETPAAVDFAAIFESLPHSAVILHINQVKKEYPDEEGNPVYKGYGEVWFKMFRQFVGNKQDVCYREGNYAHLAPRHIPLPTKRCWFLDIGPYSCLPKGIRTIESFDLRGDRPCYKKLGEFRDLDIRKAFHVDPEENHP